MNFKIFTLVILAVIFNTAAQISLKAGMNKIGKFSFSWDNFMPIFTKAVTTSWIISGAVISVISLLVWLVVLSRTPVSIAYPMASLGYITSAVAAYCIWGENLTPLRIAGIIIILFGVYLVAKN